MTKPKDTIDWNQIAQEETPKVHQDFFHPLVETLVELHDEIKDAPCDTAYFDFRTNRTHMSKQFLEDMVEIGGLEARTAFRGVLKHEWGHYLVYPRECAILMFLGHIAKPNFGEHKDEILAYWNDVKDNLPQMLKKLRGQDVRDMYKGMNKVFEKELTFSSQERELLQAADVDPEEIRGILREYSVDRLLTAYYQRQTEEDFGVDLGESFLAEKLEKIVLDKESKPIIDTVTVRDEQDHEQKKKQERKEGLMTLDILNKEAELQNFIMFGTIIQDIIKKREEALAPYKKKLGDKYGRLVGGKAGPHHHDGPKLGDFGEKQINEGLDEVIRKWGKGRYEKIRKFVEEETGKNFDLPQPRKGAGAGLAHSKIQLNDEQVPYYERKARTYGLYIHRKPLVVDVLNSYPEGSEKFKVGDPMRTLDPYSTYGRILPGITKKKKLRQGTKRDKQYKVPDLTIWLDTSGSMKHPQEGSDAVLAGFVLANNYWQNDSNIGMVNFSADMAALLPTRNLDEGYSMLCAYWGGGTVVNIPKVREYMQRVARGGEERYFTSEQDYQRLVEHMHPDQRKEFLDKHVEVNLDRAVKETYEKMDTCIITDGDIYNLPEVIGYINTMAAMTRNVVFLINNPRQYTEWSKLVLPNTQIVPVEKAEDLLGLAIGEAKKIAPHEEKPTSLFWR